MSTRAAHTSATTALAGSRACTATGTNDTAMNRLVGRSWTVAGAWYPAFAISAVHEDTKHRRRPEEDASQL